MEIVNEVSKQILTFSGRAEESFDKRLITMGKLEVSINKILSSFFGQLYAREVQIIHLQVIEDVIFANPHLINDDIKEKFFKIKNAFDNDRIVPLSSEKDKESFEKMLEDVKKERESLKKWRKGLIFKGLKIFGFVFLVILFISTISTLCVNIKSNYYKLFSSQQERKTKQVYGYSPPCVNCAGRTGNAQKKLSDDTR
jgi:hypothetical protein